MGKRESTMGKRSSAAVGKKRAARGVASAPVRSRPGRRWWALGGAILCLIAVGGVLGWRSHRRVPVSSIAAGTPAGAADEREAALLRAVQAHPAQSGPHRELADYYLDHQRPFESIWELAVARETGVVDEALALHTARALKQAGLPGVALRLLSTARDDFRRPAVLSQALAETDLEVAEPAAAAQVVGASPELVTTPDGLLLLGRAHLGLGDLPAARRDWRRARQAVMKQPAGKRAHVPQAPGAGPPAPRVPPALPSAGGGLALGRLGLALGDVPAAREELAAAARENPTDEAAQYYAGLAYSTNGGAAGTTQAIEYFKAATRADPHQARGGVALGRLLYEKSGQWERAASVYRQALSMDSHCVAAEEGLARVRAALKQPGEVAYHQARIRELRSRPDEALQWYRRWGELRPQRWDSVLRAAECSMDMQQYLAAVREVQRGLQRHPANPELLSQLAQLYLRTNSRPEAARVCDEWAPVDRTSGRPEWVRGQLAAKALRDADAIRWFEQAIARNPNVGAYHAALGEQLVSQPTPERLKRARVELERAVALDPGMALYHVQLGVALQKLDDAEGARRAFLRALDHDGDRLDAYAGVMAAARSLRQPRVAAFFARLERETRDRERDEAAARLDLSTRPRDTGAQLRLGRLVLRRGDLAGARDHLAIAAEQPDGSPARPLLQQVERLLSVL